MTVGVKNTVMSCISIIAFDCKCRKLLCWNTQFSNRAKEPGPVILKIDTCSY